MREMNGIKKRKIEMVFLIIVLALFSLKATEVKAMNTNSLQRAGKCGDNLEWMLLANGMLYITGEGAMYDGEPEWYESLADYIKRVVVEEGVTCIGDWAFANCENLEEVEIASTVESIGKYAFYECDSLTSIKIPEGIEEIAEFTFYGCTNMRTVQMPDSVKRIGEAAFYKCQKLEDMVLPNELSVISDFAFSGCDNIYNITLPQSVTVLGKGAFGSCQNLKKIELSENITNINYWTFGECISLKNIKLPEKIESIEERAFFSCINLEEIVLSSNVKEIGKYAFKDCGKLKKIIICKDAPICGEKIFDHCLGIINIYVPKGATGYDREPWRNYNIIYGKTNSIEDLEAYASGKNKVLVKWQPVEGAEGYLIYGIKNSQYDYVGMTTKGTSFVDKKALDYEYNFYWVFPYYIDENGNMVPGGCTKYVYAKGVCPAVTNLKASSVKGGVKLTWTAAAGAEGYLVYGIENGGQYGYVGMTSGTTFTAKKASKTVYNFYWIFPYHKNAEGKMITGGVVPYTYGRAR